MRNQVFFARLGAVLGGLAVVVGAFGAHGLKARVSAEALAVFEVGVRYHMYHALAIFALSVAVPALWQSKWAWRACAWWTFGIAIFSGSLYLMTLTGLKWLGAITPIGGVALIGGWAMAAVAAGGLLRGTAEA
jgi:uncharacterized membrane protein YgdD (TMEM256/DUF423 family)